MHNDNFYIQYQRLFSAYMNTVLFFLPEIQIDQFMNKGARSFQSTCLMFETLHAQD